MDEEVRLRLVVAETVPEKGTVGRGDVGRVVSVAG